MDMCNCLKYKKILFKSDQKTGGSIFHALFHTLKKTLTFSFLFIIFISATQAKTYYWVGGTSEDWNTGSNWNTKADGSGTSGVPGSGDIVYIQSNASISIGTNDISVDGISLGSNNQSESFSVTISGTGTLTVGNHTFTENSADKGIVTYRPTNTLDTSKTSSLILDCNVSASNLAIHSGGNVSISSGKTVTIPTITNMSISASTPTELNVEGTLISSTSITIANFPNQTIKVGSSGIISASSISANNGTITNDGLIITQPPIITSALNTASTGITTTASAGSFIWTGASDTDWNTAGNWLGGNIPSSSSIITIPPVTNQPVIASGKSVTIDNASNLIFDTGSSITVDGTLKLTGDFTIDSKITEASSGNLIISGTLANTESFTSSTLNLECTNISAGSNLEFKNITLATGASISGNASITCEDITFNGSASVGSDISLDYGDLFASGNVSFAGNYTNNGSANFANGLTLAGDFTDLGTSFFGTITLNGSSNQSFAGKEDSSPYDVVVNKSTGDLEFTNALTLTSLDTNNYTGRVTFSGTGTQTLTPQPQVYQSITVNKSSGSLLVNGNLQAKTLSVTSGEILLEGNLTLTDGSSFQDVDFSGSSGKITFTGGTSSTPRILKAGKIKLSDKIYTLNSTDYLKIEASNASNIELSSCTNIANLILETNGNISINGIKTGTLSLSSSASSIKMGGSIKLTDGSQDLIIDYPLVLFADTSFDIAGNIIIKDSASPAKVGSINSDSDSTARALTLKAGSGKSIEIQNGSSIGAGLGTTTSLSTIKINNSIVISANTEFKTSGALGTTFAGSGNSISGSYILSFTGNFTDSNNWTYDNGLTLNFIGTNNQTITTNSTSTYPTIIENKDSGTLSINGNCTINNFVLTKGTTTTFTGNPTITSFTDTASSGNINFNNGGTITSTGDQTFLTRGRISFGDDPADTMTFGTSPSYSNLTHTEGPTNLAGTINANNITLSSSELNNAVNVNCSKITLQDSLAYKNDSYYLKVTGNLNTKNSISIGQNVMLDGSFTSEDGVPVFKKNLYIFKGTNTASSVTINSLSLTGDLIINAERAINTRGTITVGNFVLYHGQISAAANSIIHTRKDVVLYGPQYSPTDPTRLSDTSNTAYSYQQTRTSCPCNYTESATMPDGTSLPTPSDGYTGLYDAGAGARFYVEKNWYANGLMDSTSSPTRGLTSSTSGQWYIDLPNLIDTQNQTGFAETYNSYVTYSTVRCHADNSYDESGEYAKMPAYNCQYPTNAVSGEPENDVNWIFEDFSIVKAYTVRDNVICLFFNHSVRNSSAELKNAVSRFVNSADSFAGFYTNADCNNELGNNTNLTPDSSGNVYIYIKASNSTTWNTDATGTDAGSDSSTNRNGIHQTVIPFIKISENGNLPITDIWGKRLAYYDNEYKFTDISDHTGPVLYSVRTGQELHTPYSASTGENSQPSYDAHNFLEFRYSEKVNFGSISAAAPDVTANVFDNSNTSAELWLPAAASTTADQTVNVRVHDSFGALTHDVTQSGNLTLAGLAKIATGKLYTASEGTPSKYVNALYRPDAYSIRLSIAGYTEGSASDQANNSYKKWIGYIENAIQPAGLVTMISNSNSMVTDCALDLDGSTPLYNAQEKYKNPVIPSVNVNYSNGSDYTDSGVYSDWDLSEPVFAPLRLDSNASWGLGDYYEAVGTNSGSGSTLDKIEFHFFDNTPYYSDQDEAAWLSEKGWVTNESGSNTLYDADYTYCADIIGGARQFDPNASQRTTGGLRFSTKENCSTAFKYSTSQASSAVTDKSFASGSSSLNIGAKASLFVGASTTRRSATDPDGLYFGLGLIDTSYPVSQSFTVSYNDAGSYITDLAGNRLRTSTIKTIDRTPPSYDITISPINQKELRIVFVKKLVVDSEKIKYRDNSGNQIELDEDFVNLIPKCFELVTISDAGIASKSEGLQIDYTIPAKFEHIISQTNESVFTALTLTLTQNTTLKDLENLYLRLIYAEGYNEYSQDPITSINDSRVTFIQDEFGNYMQMYEAHAISDFAINVINPLYAYDAEMTYNDEVIMNGLYTQGSWAVTDWNADQQNYGSLPANHAWDIVAQIDDGNQKLENIPAGTRIFMAQTQTENSVSSQYNQDLNQNLRIWLPNVTNSIIAALAPVNNDLSNISQVDSTFLNDGSFGKIDFSISSEITSIWGANKQITFLFSLLDSEGQLIRIYNSPYFNVTSNSYDFSLSTALPLFAIRLKDNSDITSLDLWSVKTKSITDQRGGVTILNNVINATNGEKVVVKVDNPSNGKLNVIVMTIDGNIISYLNRASTAAGTYYYSWDGKNKSGNKVARGMYFIRVVGNGIDETRKVMVVK